MLNKENETLSKFIKLEDFPTQDLLNEAVSFLNVAGWEIRTDTTIYYIDEIEKLRQEFGLEMDYLIDLHETLQRIRFGTRALVDLFILNWFNYSIIEFIDEYLRIYEPIQLKELFLTNAIVFNRLLAECIPLLEAISTFELYYSPQLRFKERSKVSALLSVIEGLFWRANPKARPCYDKIMHIYELTQNPEIPSLIINIALNYPELNYTTCFSKPQRLKLSYLVTGLPPHISPSQRFLTLYEGLNILDGKKPLKTLPVIRAIPNPWKKPIEHHYRVLDFLRYIYKHIPLPVEPINVQEVHSRIYRIMMKRVIKRERIPIEKQKIVSRLYDSTLRMHFKNRDNEWMVFTQFRKDLKHREIFNLLVHICLTSVVHQILNSKKEIDCCLQVLDRQEKICKRNCSKCIFNEFITKSKKAKIFLKEETPLLEYLWLETKKELYEVLGFQKRNIC